MDNMRKGVHSNHYQKSHDETTKYHKSSKQKKVTDLDVEFGSLSNLQPGEEDHLTHWFKDSEQSNPYTFLHV